jgi:hypothetical protein
VKCEDNKATFKNAGGPALLLAAMEVNVAQRGCLFEICGALRAITSADDQRKEMSGAFDAAKEMVEMGTFTFVFQSMLKYPEDAEMLANLCAVAKCLLTSGEATDKLVEQGGLKLITDTLKTHVKHAGVARHATSVLRNVAGSADHKGTVMHELPLVTHIATIHVKEHSVLEQVYALLAAGCLRAPETGVKVAEAGFIPLVSQGMRQHIKRAVMLRQACLLLRNMVVRCPELKQPMLDEEIEPTLREIHALRGCDDEAYAVLRDLGCELDSLKRKNVSKEAYVKHSNFRDEFSTSDNIEQAMTENAHAPFHSAGPAAH